MPKSKRKELRYWAIVGETDMVEVDDGRPLVFTSRRSAEKMRIGNDLERVVEVRIRMVAR
jgi:hypothetical protein